MSSIFSKNIVFTVFFIVSTSIVGMAQTEKKALENDWFKTLDHTKLTYWATAFGLKKGEHYYQNLYLLWQQFHFGITDNFSLGVSVELASVVFGETFPVVSFNPKYTEPLEINNKIHVGVGNWTVLGLDSEDYLGLSILYGLVSYGSVNNNVTIGIGHGKYGEQWTSFPQINLGFNTRVRRSIGISSEIWILEIERKEIDMLINFGIKLIGQKGTLDIGLLRIAPLSEYDFTIPVISLTIPFGKNFKKK